MLKKIKFNIPNIKGKLKYNEIKKFIPDMYIQCPCGSGRKYKFCCYGVEDEPFHNPNEVYMYVVKQKNKRFFCMHEDEMCHKEIIKAHSIQNNKILSKLAFNGHVYTIEFDQDEFGGIGIKKCGKKEATVATCFCKYHDVEIFKDIETKDYQYKAKQNFLYAYRAFLKYYYDRIVGLDDTRAMFKVTPNMMMAIGVIERLKGLEKSIEENEIIKKTFNIALDNEKYDEIQTITFELDYEVGFATAYMAPLSYDLKGNEISNVYSLEGRMKNIYVSVFPESGRTYILISWLKEDEEYFTYFRKQFDMIKLNKELLLRVLNNMVACQTDNIVFSKKLLDKWGEDKKKFFLTQLGSLFWALNEENVGLLIEKNLMWFKCEFDLFERI